MKWSQDFNSNYSSFCLKDSEIFRKKNILDLRFLDIGINDFRINSPKLNNHFNNVWEKCECLLFCIDLALDNTFIHSFELYYMRKNPRSYIHLFLCLLFRDLGTVKNICQTKVVL